MKLKSSNRNPGKQTLRLALYQSQSFSSLSLIVLSSSILLLFNNGKSDYSFFEIFCFILTTKGYWYLNNLCETASHCCKGIEWIDFIHVCVCVYGYIYVCVRVYLANGGEVMSREVEEYKTFHAQVYPGNRFRGDRGRHCHEVPTAPRRQN